MTKSGRSIRRSFARVPISTLLKPVTNEAAYLSNEVARFEETGAYPTGEHRKRELSAND
jgi:hypothetical protein